jgi:hypothetical protein
MTQEELTEKMLAFIETQDGEDMEYEDDES